MTDSAKMSLKRSKPNYIYSIVGVALVLLIMGIMGWFFLNINAVGNTFKEDIRVSAYLRTLNKDTISQIQAFIAERPYTKTVTYVNKQSAQAIWNKENSEDWAKILDSNPLPESIDFYAKAEYVNQDSLSKIASELMARYGNQLTDIQYPKSLVTSLNERASKIGLIFLVVAIILCSIVIISIDNTIRLAMFSNRFLIKTMQMVGATRGFIIKPLTIKAIINGLVSSGIAITLVFIIVSWAESQFPQLKAIRNFQHDLLLYGGLILMGVGISVYSTHRSVLKYLKMKLDDLY
jgi:cell division transport system permease protein